jgi:hypothetical protein
MDIKIGYFPHCTMISKLCRHEYSQRKDRSDQRRRYRGFRALPAVPPSGLEILYSQA